MTRQRRNTEYYNSSSSSVNSHTASLNGNYDSNEVPLKAFSSLHSVSCRPSACGHRRHNYRNRQRTNGTVCSLFWSTRVCRWTRSSWSWEHSFRPVSLTNSPPGAAVASLWFRLLLQVAYSDLLKTGDQLFENTKYICELTKWCFGCPLFHFIFRNFDVLQFSILSQGDR